MNRVDRLFAITLRLQSKRLTTAEELARHFEVSVRTIYRDMTALSEAGIPVISEAGVGYTLRKGYFLPPINFTEQEAQAISLGALLVTRLGGENLGDAATSAKWKVQAVLPAEAKERINRLAPRLETLYRVPSPGSEHLPLCARSIVDRRVLKLCYVGSKKEESARVVEPLGTILHEHVWYLIAWCRLRRAYRTFRLDRVRAVNLVGAVFEGHAEFDLKKYLDGGLGTRSEKRAKLWFSKKVADRAARQLGPAIQVRQAKNGGEEVTATVWGYGSFARWLLTFGNQARAIGPAELRSAMAAQVAELAKLYDDC